MSTNVLTFTLNSNIGETVVINRTTFTRSAGNIYTGAISFTTIDPSFTHSQVVVEVDILSLLTGITIPNSVTSIGDNAFEECSELSSIYIPNSVTSIGDIAFVGCVGLSSIVIPNSVTSIGRYIMMNCSSLTNVTLPNGITLIPESMFFGCVNLQSVSIPNSVTSIGINAFRNTISLTSIRIPTSVTSIERGAFINSGLTSIIIPDSVINIGIDKTTQTLNSSTFNDCTGLTTITISNTLTQIGTTAFIGCTNLTNVRVRVQQPNETITSNLYSRLQQVLPSASKTTIVKPSHPTVTSALYNYAFNRITLQYTPGSVDTGDAIQFFEYRINSLDWQPVPQNRIIAYNTYNTTDTIQLRQYTQYAGYSDPTAAFNIIVDIPCFKKDTKILTNNGYKRIQDIRKGDMVQTDTHGYKAVYAIGYKKLQHNATCQRIKNQLYRCSRSQYPELFEDLIITGCHSILIPEFTSQEQVDKTTQVLGQIYMTDDLYRLPACADDRTTVYETPGEYTIYHLALENDNYYYNYGIYANGLLVETCSKRYLKELSNMTLIE